MKRALPSLKKAGKTDPLLGGITGALPQCGFSVVATNLFAGRVISVGTIVAVYLSTSDEMLAVMLGSNVSFWRIAKIILLKTAIGILAGFGVDIVHRIRVKYSNHTSHRHSDAVHDHQMYINELCTEECHCDHGNPAMAAFRHTVKIFAVIFTVTFLLNFVIDLAGIEIIAETIAKAGIWAPVVAGRGMTKATKIRIMVTVTLLMSFGFFMMFRKALYVPCMILGGVWLFHILYFALGVKTIPVQTME